MKAIGVNQFLPTTHPECFIAFDTDIPPLAIRDLLVQVKAVSVNPVDHKVRTSLEDRLDTPRVLGWDAAGIVIQTGAEVSLFQPGDHVYYAGSITRPGCNSQYHVVDERIVGHKPLQLTFEAAAALPLTTITAWEALFERLRISSDPLENVNRTILLIGGAGGVGSIAIQLAKKVAGLRVIATASREASKAWCLKMGADDCINHTKNFRMQLEKLNIAEVDYIFCLTPIEAYWESIADVIKAQGKICGITTIPTPIDLNLIKNKSATFVWEFMFTKSMYTTEDIQSQHDLLNQVSNLMDQGILQSTLTEHFGSLNTLHLAQAHARLESGQMIGKLVLSEIE